ncbi:hypothetical protein [uncultured Dokdonia sp.]|uniref:hypothetical protein n=1 Tax=uncultured Dokdonia sp. TaxID=575653 RepID=UPI00261D57BD|nr:hypothetical protein [uncultured Dokdonia sp.]
MKIFRLVVVFSFICILSCSEDDKVIDEVVQEIERGAILRNVNKIRKDFIHNDFESAFELEIEAQDIEDGALLDFVRLYIDFRDQTDSDVNLDTQEVMLRDVPASVFEIGPNGLPRTTVLVSYQEAVTALSVNTSLITPGDQFGLRMEIHLIDGRTFSNSNNSASILTDACFFKSPLRYEINVLEVIPNELFTGTYSYEVVNGADEFSFHISNQGIVSIFESNLPNVRTTSIIGEGLEVTIAGENIFPKIYQSVNLFCRESAPHILSGPDDTSFGAIDLNDDSTFFVDLIVGFEGWDGTLDFNDNMPGIPVLYTFKFTKQ